METTRQRGEGTRERILAAARQQFLAKGFRATAMEAIARAAGVAKPTLYAHFPDKDAVYAALIAGMLAQKQAAFATALAGPGPVMARVTAALLAKFRVLAAALDASPHAEELIHVHHRAAALIAESDEAVAVLLTATLAEAGLAEPARMTRLLTDASFGLVRARGTAPDADIALLVERLLGPELERR